MEARARQALGFRLAPPFVGLAAPAPLCVAWRVQSTPFSGPVRGVAALELRPQTFPLRYTVPVEACIKSSLVVMISETCRGVEVSEKVIAPTVALAL